MKRLKIEKKKITKNIYLLIFKNQYDITSTFLRFQEFYESPKFQGKIFTLEEYKKWYSKLKGGKFTYYTDWNGFNIPSKVLIPFYEGKFNPLSEKEKQILDLFKNDKGKYYIIAIHKRDKNYKETLKHEIAHGLFYTQPKYKSVIIKLIKRFKLEEAKKTLLKAGYSKEVLDDEIQAYSIDSSGKLKPSIPRELKKEIRKIFLKFYKNTN